MQWPNPIKKAYKLAATSGNLPYGDTFAPSFTDSHLNPTWGPTKGWLAMLSGDIKGVSEKSYSFIDFNFYDTLRTDYNKLVADYNTAAKTYSTAAKKYLDDVAARKKQLADPLTAAFETPVAVPKVPCLSQTKPGAWPGRTPYVPAAAALLSATATQSERASKFSYAYINSDFISTPMEVTKTAVPSEAFKWDFKAGYMTFNRDATVATVDPGLNHVFGLLG